MRHFLLAVLLSVPFPAFAQVASGEHEFHERPTVGTHDGPQAFGTKPSRMGMSFNTDPVIAEAADGQLVDKRTGLALDADEVKDARQREKYHEKAKDVVLWKGKSEYEQSVIKKGTGETKYGEASVEVLKATSNQSLKVGARSIEATAESSVSLIEVNAETEATFAIAEGVDAGIKAEVQAMIGAEAEGKVSASITKDGIHGNVGLSAFAGAKVECTITPSVMVCGIQVDAVGKGSVSYGAGVEASAYFAFDWSKMSMRVGAKGGLTAGLGAGVDGEVEVSLQKVLKDPKASAKCLWDLNEKLNQKTNELLAKAYTEILNSGAYDKSKEAVTNLVSWFSKPNADPKSGLNLERDADSRPILPAFAGATGRGTSMSAGVTR